MEKINTNSIERNKLDFYTEIGKGIMDVKNGDTIPLEQAKREIIEKRKRRNLKVDV